MLHGSEDLIASVPISQSHRAIEHDFTFSIIEVNIIGRIHRYHIAQWFPSSYTMNQFSALLPITYYKQYQYLCFDQNCVLRTGYQIFILFWSMHPNIYGQETVYRDRYLLMLRTSDWRVPPHRILWKTMWTVPVQLSFS